MASDGADLLFRIKADGSQAKKEIGETRAAISKEVKGITNDFASGVPVIGRFAGALGPVGIALGVTAGAAVAVGGALLAATKQAIETGSRFNDLAIKTGLTVETLSGLELQLRQSGTSSETLSNSVFEMQKRLEGAAGGSKELRAAFAELGIADTEAALRDTDGTLRTLLKSLGEIDDEGKRNALGAQVLGRQYKELAVFVKDLGGDVDGAIAKAKRLGLVMSTEAAEGADVLGDKIDEIGLRAERFTVLVGSSLVPEITRAIDDIGRALGLNEGDWSSWSNWIADQAANARASIAGVAAMLRAFRDRESWGGISEAGDRAAEESRRVSDQYRGRHYDLSKELPDYQKQMGAAALDRAMRPFRTRTRSGGGGSGGGGGSKGKDPEAERLKQLEKEARELAQEYERERAALVGHGEAMLRLAEEYDKARIASARAMADLRAKTQEETEQKVFDIETAAFNRRLEWLRGQQNAVLAAGGVKVDEAGNVTGDVSKLSGESLRELRAIQDDINQLIAEQESRQDEHARKMDEARRADVESARRRALELRQVEQNNLDLAFEIGQMKIDLLERFGASRREIARAEAQQENALEDARHARALEELETRRQEILEAVMLEEERVRALAAIREGELLEEERHRTRKSQIKRTEDQETDPFSPLKDIWADFKKNATDADGAIEDSLGSLSASVAGSLENMGGALKGGIAAWALYGDSIGKALKKAAAEQLAALAGEFGIMALKHAAYALGSLAFGDFGSAARHAAAAAAFAGAAVAAGVAARSLASGASGGGAGTGSGAGAVAGEREDNRTRLIREAREGGMHSSSELRRGGGPPQVVVISLEDGLIGRKLNEALDRHDSNVEVAFRKGTYHAYSTTLRNHVLADTGIGSSPSSNY